MDRRTVLTLLVVLLVFAGFSALQSRYAPKRKPVPPAIAESTLASPGATAADTALTRTLTGAATLSATAPTAGAPAAVSLPVREVSLETPLYHARFSSRGARLLSVELKQYAAAHGESNYGVHPNRRPRRGQEIPAADRVLLANSPLFGIDLGSRSSLRSLADVVYAVAESADASGQVRALTFTSRDSASGTLVRQTWRVRENTYALDLEVEVRGLPDAWRLSEYSLTSRTWPLVTEANLQQDQRSVRGVSLVGTNLHRDGASGLVNKDPKVHDGAARFAGVQSHYFMALVASTGDAGRAALTSGLNATFTADQLQRMPANTPRQMQVAVGTLVMPLPTTSAPVQRFVTYFGPGDYAVLSKLGFDLHRAVDLGWNWITPVSQLLLVLLKAIERVVHNYGVNIILLATLVRLLLHPVNMASMKSMRSMTKLQPEIERLREKYKNDPQALNAATMAMYKENKVNPAGGCLPMILQMPLFIALYSVLMSAIDLRQAPFVGWIHDLSAPDQLLAIGPLPIRVLPILMALTGFLSQVLAPTNPQQAPTMYMMNFVMLFFFYNLPSGLVLYWTVMNVLTALQQWMVNRSDVGVVVVPEAAGKGGKAGNPRRRG